MIEAQAHGKILLCGEYAALLGGDALGVASSGSLRVKLSQDPFPACYEGSSVMFDPLSQNRESALMLVISYLYSYFSAAISKDPIYLHIDSTIAQGRGMGSSAALCVALYKAFLDYSGLREEEEEEEVIFSLLRECENFFHGTSSGIDPALCFAPQACRVHVGPRINADSRPLFIAKKRENLPQLQKAVSRVSQGMSWLKIDTGAAQSSTKECVAMAWAQKKAFHKYAQEYPGFLQRLLKGAYNDDPELIRRAITEMHRGLTTLQVVPKRVQSLIKAIEEVGAAAKISGAGSINEAGAGILIAYGQRHLIEKLCQDFDYRVDDLVSAQVKLDKTEDSYG